MKRLIGTTALIMGMALSAYTANAAEVLIDGPAALDKKGTMEVSGTGFAPNSEIILLFTTKDGVESDIGYALKPAPKADGQGNWATTWSYGRFVKKKLVAEGAYNLVVTDADFAPIATGNVNFVK